MQVPLNTTTYDKEPEIPVQGFDNHAFRGYEQILSEIKKRIAREAANKDKIIVAVDCYPGVREEVLQAFMHGLSPALTINADELFYAGDRLTALMQRHLTDDRVFGVMYYGALGDFLDEERVQHARGQVEDAERGVVLICGVGASLLCGSDILIYADLARWEIQQRYRSREMGNFNADNHAEDTLRKYKRAFFIEWRVADKHKAALLNQIDYLLDTNVKDDPKMVTGDALRAGLEVVVQRPFRLVPYFDEGIWGGEWMEQVCGLKKKQRNFAWCFDGVPEENSLYLRYGDVRIEIPAVDAVLYRPIPLLGEKVFARFGAEFPIRFNFLDTMGGGNLSLQVHPDIDYAKKNFGIAYTQEESYYILDAGPDAVVYLGLKEGVDKDAMLEDLYCAQSGEIAFDAEKYVNIFPAKKHDHFLIPPGTIHCSGKNCMVLEISATQFLFTFKLWDWGRVGLDGIPRPTHIDHGRHVIRWDRTTPWVQENLVDAVQVLQEAPHKVERTGLHELEFIETRRYTFDQPIHLNTGHTVKMLNLVEGEQAVIQSPDNRFEPFVVHYAETFIIPAQVGAYTIAPHGSAAGKKIRVIEAGVRT